MIILWGSQNFYVLGNKRWREEVSIEYVDIYIISIQKKK